MRLGWVSEFRWCLQQYLVTFFMGRSMEYLWDNGIYIYIIMKTYIYIFIYLYNDTYIYIHIIYYAFQWDILWELYGIWDVHGIRIEWDIFIWLIKDGRPLDSCGRLMHGINRDDFHWPPPFWIPSEHSHGKWPIYRWFTYGLPIKNGDFPWLC